MLGEADAPAVRLAAAPHELFLQYLLPGLLSLKRLTRHCLTFILRLEEELLAEAAEGWDVAAGLDAAVDEARIAGSESRQNCDSLTHAGTPSASRALAATASTDERISRTPSASYERRAMSSAPSACIVALIACAMSCWSYTVALPTSAMQPASTRGPLQGAECCRSAERMGLAMFVGVLPLEEMSRRAHSTELKVIWASCEPEAPDMFPNRAKIGSRGGCQNFIFDARARRHRAFFETRRDLLFVRSGRRQSGA